MLMDAILSALLNVVILAGIPFLIYFLVQRRRGHSLGELLRRVGLQAGDLRYAILCVPLSGLVVAALLIWPPPLEPYLRDGSPQASFVGLGLRHPAIPMALLYGIIKTGFSEEVLFRGMLAGSLSRKMPHWAANLTHAVIFLLPHLLVLTVMPELGKLLPIIFLSSLLVGWIRIRSGSILGPWLMHAAANVTVCLSVSVRSVSG